MNVWWVREKIPHFVLMTNFAMAFLILWQNGSFQFCCLSTRVRAGAVVPSSEGVRFLKLLSSPLSFPLSLSGLETLLFSIFPSFIPWIICLSLGAFHCPPPPSLTAPCLHLSFSHSACGSVRLGSRDERSDCWINNGSRIDHASAASRPSAHGTVKIASGLLHLAMRCPLCPHHC